MKFLVGILLLALSSMTFAESNRQEAVLLLDGIQAYIEQEEMDDWSAVYMTDDNEIVMLMAFPYTQKKFLSMLDMSSIAEFRIFIGGITQQMFCEENATSDGVEILDYYFVRNGGKLTTIMHDSEGKVMSTYTMKPCE